MKIEASSSVLDSLEGATITSSYIDEETGLHLLLADGRVVIIAGYFALGLDRLNSEKLH